MSLTTAELTTIGNALRAESDATVVAALAAGDNNVLRDWCNDDAAPDYWIRRKLVSVEEVKAAINMQNIADLTATDKDRALALIELRGDGGYNGEVASDRSAWDDVFSAAAGDESQQAIAALWQREASNAEKMFALSTDTGATTATPDTTSWQGDVTRDDVRVALDLTA